MNEEPKSNGFRVTPPTGKRPEFTVELVLAGDVAFLDTLDARKDEHRERILAKIEQKFPACAEHRSQFERDLIAEGASWNPAEEEGDAPRVTPPSLFDDVEPASDPVEGAALLSELADTIRRFVILPDGAAETIALWIAHTYALDAFDFTPRLTVSSPVKRCGKTTLLDTVRGACARSIPAVNLTTASLFRLISTHRPTLVLDEADNMILGRDADQEMRGILNSGFRRGEFVVRTVGDDHEPQPFDVFGPVAFGLIGKLPDTLADRSIVVEMRRKHVDEIAERARPSELVETFRRFRPRLARWTKDTLHALRNARPKFPAELGDRERDCWEPLLAIADTAGGAWSDLARTAATKLGRGEEEEDVAGVMLLVDIRSAFEKAGSERLKTSSLLAQLNAMEDRPWPTWGRGRELSPRQLGKLLAPFRIKPNSIRLPDGSTPKGYQREWFRDAWNRYLDADTPDSPATPATTRREQDLCRNPMLRVADSSATPEERCGNVAASVADGSERNSGLRNDVADVAANTGRNGTTTNSFLSRVRSRLSDEIAEQLDNLLDDRDRSYRLGVLDVDRNGTADELRRYVDELLADDRDDDARELVRRHYAAAVRCEILPIDSAEFPVLATEEGLS